MMAMDVLLYTLGDVLDEFADEEQRAAVRRVVSVFVVERLDLFRCKANVLHYFLGNIVCGGKDEATYRRMRRTMWELVLYSKTSDTMDDGEFERSLVAIEGEILEDDEDNSYGRPKEEQEKLHEKLKAKLEEINTVNNVSFQLLPLFYNTRPNALHAESVAADG